MSDEQRTPKIFVSYRRADSRDITERIHDRLVVHFGMENVFLDVDRDNIPVGTLFPEILTQKLDESDVVLAIIGRDWEDMREHDDPSKRRLDNPDDFVRIEIENSLKRPFVSVIPVLVDNADMPQKLPKPLRPLTLIQALPVRRNPYFHDDMSDLIQGIEARAAEKQMEKARAIQEEKDRKRREQEAREREKEKQRQELAQQQAKERQQTTTELLAIFDIAPETLEANRQQRFTPEQEMHLSSIRRSNIMQLPCMILVLIGFGIVSAFLCNSLWIVQIAMDAEDVTTGRTIGLVGTGIMVFILLFTLFMWVQDTFKQPSLKKISGRFHNLHIDDGKKLGFSIGKKAFKIDNLSQDERERIRRELDIFRNQHLKMYYVGSSTNTLIQSIELVAPGAEESSS